MLRPLLEGWKEHKMVYTANGKPQYSVRYCESIQYISIAFVDDRLDLLSYCIEWLFHQYVCVDNGRIAQLCELIKAVRVGSIPGFSVYDGDTEWEYFFFTVDSTGIIIRFESGFGKYYNCNTSSNTLEELIDVTNLYIEAHADILSTDVLEYDKDEYEPVKPTISNGAYPHYNFMADF